MNPQQKVRDLAKQAGAVITAEEVDEFAKMIALLEQRHRSEIKEYEDILLRLARCFYRDIGTVHKHTPGSLYTKIIWGINDLTK